MDHDYPLPSYTLDWEEPPPKYRLKPIKGSVPPAYNVIVVQPTPVLQPTQVTVPKRVVKKPINKNPRKHLCACERGCECCLNTMCCFPGEYSQHECGTSCRDMLDFRVYCGSDDDGICLGVLCFPITLIMKLYREVPCVCYNMCRNKCEGTTGLDYFP
jgi:hypothetical protein